MSSLNNSYSANSLKHSFKLKSKLPKICNFSTSETMQSGVLSRLKSRKQKSEFQISPQYAAQVVKNYLLPMFESSKVHKIDLNRHQLMGLPSGVPSRDSTAESSVYKELKLSEKLLVELENLKVELAQTKDLVSLSEQEKYEYKAEIYKLAQENEILTINLKMVNSEVNSFNRNTHALEMKNYLAQKQLENYKKMINSSKEKLEQLTQALHSELNKNDIRLNFHVFFNHFTQVKI